MAEPPSQTVGPADSLARHMAWLKIEDCPCPFGWTSMGTLYGVHMGKGWGRLSTTRGCRHHDLCQKRMKQADKPQPAWAVAPHWCHRIQGHTGPCSVACDATNATEKLPDTG